MMIDIDYFKEVNDKYGHVVGDQVIQSVSYIISNNLRAEDMIARYGGEEFIAVIYDINQESIMYLAERLKMAVAEYNFIVHGTDKVFKRTISIGLTQYHANEQLSELLTRADKALYDAKHSGRDKVVIV